MAGQAGTRPSGSSLLLALLLAVIAGLWWSHSRARSTDGHPATPAGLVVILMHGRGAPADDLQSLADELSKAAPGARFILPAGPHPLGHGRTWYPHFTESTQEAVDRHLRQLRAQARGVVMGIVKDLRAQGVPDERIYVGGFSQGATVALDVVLSHEGSRLGGLISLSGGALELDLAALKGRALLHAFVSHGRSDPVINNRFSKSLVAALQEGHHEVQFVEFDDGHAIPATVRHALGLFLHAH